MKLGFIGAGRMAEAIIRGLLSAKSVPQKDIFISDKDTNRIKQLSKRFNVKALDANTEIVASCDVLVLAVKPQVMGQVLSQISKKIGSGQLIISIAAGITLKSLEKYFGKAAVIRAMPNNPALIGEGITAICGGKFAEESDIKLVEKLFSSVGETMRVDERYMNAVTALSGSGPAFVYEVLDALVNGGVEAGLSKEMASKLAEKTMIGSIKTVIKTKKTPLELKEMVTSPGGTTIAGIRVLEEGNFKSLLAKAVVKAGARAKEISEDFDKSL